MTTSTRSRTPKAARSKTSKLSKSINHLTIDGKDYVLMPAEEFEELLIDHMLGVISEERRSGGKDELIPIEEVAAKHRAKKMRKR